MVWDNKNVVSVEKGFFSGDEEPKAILFFESLGFWKNNQTVGISKRIWEEIGNVMGWKTK